MSELERFIKKQLNALMDELDVKFRIHYVTGGCEEDCPFCEQERDRRAERGW